MATPTSDSKTDSTPAPDKRDTDTNEPVTQLASVDANTSLADMKSMAGVDGDGKDSDQQGHVLAAMKDAKANAKDPSKPVNPQAAANPFLTGPGGDIS